MSVVIANMEDEVPECDADEEEVGNSKSRAEEQIEDGEDRASGGRNENKELKLCSNHNCAGDDADNDASNDAMNVDPKCFGRRCGFADLSYLTTCRQRMTQYSKSQLLKLILVSFCCFGANVMIIGFIISLSIYYVELKLAFPHDLKYVTLAVFLPTGIFGCAGVISGYAVNKFGTRVAMVCGSLLLSSGIILCCFAPTVPYILAFLGIMSGTGCSLIYISMNTSMAYHFPDVGRILISLITIGESFGLIIFPTLVSYLVDVYSWRGSFLVLGATVLHCLPFGLVYSMKTEYFYNRKCLVIEPEPPKKDVSETTPAFKEPSESVLLPNSISKHSCVSDMSSTAKEDNCLQTEEILHSLSHDEKKSLLSETKETLNSTVEMNGKTYQGDLTEIPYIEKTAPFYTQDNNKCSENSLKMNSNSNINAKSTSQPDISKNSKQTTMKNISFILSNKNFILFLGTLFIAVGNINTMVTVLPDYCYSVGFTVNEGAWIFSVGAIGDIISRILGALFLYMKIPSIVIYAISVFSSSIFSLIFPFISSMTAITVVTFFYILTSGIAFAVYTIVVLDFFNLELYSLSTGLSESVSGVGIILSGFFIGLITEYQNNDYTISFYIVSIMNVIAMLPSLIFYLYNQPKKESQK